MTPVLIELPDIIAGDTWEGLTVGPVLFNSAQPASALASCRLYFRNAKKELVYGFRSTVAEGYGLITITDAAAWTAVIAPQAIELPAGKYTWDFETTDAAGIVRTLYYGTQKVTQDSSHD